MQLAFLLMSLIFHVGHGQGKTFEFSSRVQRPFTSGQRADTKLIAPLQHLAATRQTAAMVNGTHSQHPTNGMGNGGYAGGSDTIKRAVVAFTAIAWYNIIEILVLVFFVFKRYSGIYFWSLVITTIAMFPYSLGRSQSFDTSQYLPNSNARRIHQAAATATRRPPIRIHHFAELLMGGHDHRPVHSPVVAAALDHA